MLIGLQPYDFVPSVVDPGSGTAGPLGIEAVIEYNGLLLNRLTDYDKYRITSIDGLADADIRDSRSVNPGRHGETAFQAFYGGRTLVLNGRIEAHTLNKLRDMQRELRLAFNELEEKPLIFKSYFGSPYDKVIYCRKGASLTMPEKQDDLRAFRDFQITMRASNPRFLTYDQRAASWIATGSTASFQFMFGPTNDGTFSAEPRMILTGPMTNPSIHNHSTDETFVLETTIPTSVSYTVDVAQRTIFDSFNQIKLGDISASSDWITLDPGSNLIEISATGLTNGVSGVSILWHDTWI